MPRDLPNQDPNHRTPVRAAVLDFLSRAGDAAGAVDDGELIAALRAALCNGRGPVDDLWEKYHRPRADRVARVYARYGY
jgi:hypothetical protein